MSTPLQMIKSLLMSYEKINNPNHYDGNGLKAIDVIEAYGLNFSLGSAVKYILRAGKKPGENTLEDLRKALWYTQRQIQMQAHTSITTTPSLSLVEVQKAFPLSTHLNNALVALLLNQLSNTEYHLQAELERITSV